MHLPGALHDCEQADIRVAPPTHPAPAWSQSSPAVVMPPISTNCPQLCAGESWTSADMVDCMLSYAATLLVDEVTECHSVEGVDMLDRIRTGGGVQVGVGEGGAGTRCCLLAALRQACWRPWAESS